MAGLTNLYVKRVLSPEVANFIGVFSCDNIPNTTLEKYSFVCNLSKHDEQGTHFVAVLVNKRSRVAHYIDPYGANCSNKHIREYLARTCHFMRWSNKAIQPLPSDYCGYYCIAYLLANSRGITHKKFMSKFKREGDANNDLTVLKLINTLLK